MEKENTEELKPIPLSSVTVGSRFSDDVYFEDGVNMFISAGKRVKLYHEEAIVRWKVPALLSCGHRLDATEKSVSKGSVVIECEPDEPEEPASSIPPLPNPPSQN
ncbi:MAG: phosphohydrolase [Treponema sp.]|nr:phosphohydrolase [Treponema sp.]